MQRSAKLQTFFDALYQSFARAKPSAEVTALAEKLFTRLEVPGDQHAPQPQNLPVCRFLQPAIDSAVDSGGATAKLATALGDITPQLAWTPIPSYTEREDTLTDRRANAEVVGSRGLELRQDIRIGVSLLAPHSLYPDHQHPPEEIYAVLSPGQWRQENGPWHSPGIGGTVHNTPHIVHSMRSASAPLLAVWCLWKGE
ncbi:dimethylsulfonioproprionate lyase family protein [Gilvimarinus chinensis]|uniref:dimethylsulfonioproprionate lyase family protein n=1 Tax=Gilvimarinus chinensis TaxID=396005 RepID=UPI00035DA012|nr:dimethylsulfonioproprionate lyase family protein [Gilvimarinus chinensis]